MPSSHRTHRVPQFMPRAVSLLIAALTCTALLFCFWSYQTPSARAQETAAAPVTQLVMGSEPGDYIGGNLDYSLSSGTFNVQAYDYNRDGGLDFLTVSYSDNTNRWNLDFATNQLGTNLAPGFYADAQRAPFAAAGHPGLNVHGNGRGCNELTGSFRVHEIEIDNTTSTPRVTKFTASFDQHCEGGPASFIGTIFYNYSGNVSTNHTISGRVADNATGAAAVGVPIKLSGTQTATTTTDMGGNYSFVNLMAGGNYRLTPSQSAGYIIAPKNYTAVDLNNNRTLNFSPVALYQISGRITNASNTGLANTVVRLSGTQSLTTTTDANGNYSFAGLRSDGNHTVTPSRDRFTFTPPSRTFDTLTGNQTADFTASAQTFAISGRVADTGGNALADTTVTLSGSQTGTMQTDANGNYSFANLVAGGNYTLTATKPSYTISPANLTFNNLGINQTANFTATFNDPAELVVNGSFETGDFTGWTVRRFSTGGEGTPFNDWSVSPAGRFGFPQYGIIPTSPQAGSFDATNGFDGAGAMQFTMHQDIAIPANVNQNATLRWRDRVQWNFCCGATLPREYKVLVVNPTNMNTLATLYAFTTPLNAGVAQDTGWMLHTANLSAFAGTTVRLLFQEVIPERYTGPGLIEFDDISYNTTAQPGQVRFSAANYRIEETAGAATITVTRSGGGTGTETVDYATSNGTATAGSDYTATSGTLTFAPGEASKSFTVPIVNNTLDEAEETVNLTLSNPTGGATLVAPLTAVLTIFRPAPPPTLRIFNRSVIERSSSSNTLQLSVQRSPSTLTTTVNYQTFDGTATANNDYGAASGGLIFAPGETSKTIFITIFADSIDEPDETFQVRLFNVTNGVIERGEATITIIDDDPLPPAQSGELLISEFRASGEGGAADEFIEIYNNTDRTVDLRFYELRITTQIVTESGTQSSAVVFPFANFNNSVPINIPARGHFLFVNTQGYSLSSIASGDLRFSSPTTIPDLIRENSSLSLRRYDFSTPIDLVGFATDLAQNREGAGLPALTASSATLPQYAFVRRASRGRPQDTNDNARDFVLVSVTGESVGGLPTTLGTPGVESLSSPTSNGFAALNLSAASLFGETSNALSRLRSGRTGKTFDKVVEGIVTMRHTFTNTRNAPLTALRFRVVDLTTYSIPAPLGRAQAEARVLSTSDANLNGQVVYGVTLDEPSLQSQGGGLNSSLRVAAITPESPLAPGASITVEFRLDIRKTGGLRFIVIPEAMP